jgi:hypothetical protein
MARSPLHLVLPTTRCLALPKLVIHFHSIFFFKTTYNLLVGNKLDRLHKILTTSRHPILTTPPSNARCPAHPKSVNFSLMVYVLLTCSVDVVLQSGYLFLSPSQPELPTGTWSPPFNSTTSHAATALRDSKQCPECLEKFSRWQDCDRHILTHLPHWIHCPLPHCSWRGNRVKSFEHHWTRTNDHLPYYESYGGIPGRDHFEIFDQRELLKQIKAGTISVGVAASHARLCVISKAVQLRKLSLLENDWGYKLKQAPQ